MTTQMPLKSATPDQMASPSEGYQTTVFSGKEKQMDEVATVVRNKGFMPEALVAREVSWFYT